MSVVGLSKQTTKVISHSQNALMLIGLMVNQSRSVHGPLSVPTEDICSLCYAFAQSHQYGSRTVDNPDSSFHSDDDELDLADTVEVTLCNGNVTRENMSPSIEHSENELIATTQHVKEAQAMRKYAQEKTALAKDDAEQKCPRNETTKILFANFSQGLSFHILEASSWERPITTHPSLFNLAKLTYHKSQVFISNQFYVIFP